MQLDMDLGTVFPIMFNLGKYQFKNSSCRHTVPKVDLMFRKFSVRITTTNGKVFGGNLSEDGGALGAGACVHVCVVSVQMGLIFGGGK